MSEESILVGYDNLMRKLMSECSDDEFLQFSISQEGSREQWLACERELERIKQEILEAEHLKAKLEARNHHAHGLLQGEIRSRVKQQQEKKELDEKLDLIRKTLCEDDAISSNAAEKLKPLLAHDLNRRSSLVCQERLDTIDEITSMTSSYIQDESSKSEEELELSGHVRSYRDIKRNLTPLREAHLSETSKRNVKQTKELREDFHGPTESEEWVAPTTTAVQSSAGPIRATNTNPCLQRIETIKGLRHSYKKQVVLHSINCRSCGQRIRFGSAALKCVECAEACHVSCEKSMPFCTPILTGDASKKKKVVTFFSPPSDSARQ